MEGQVQGKGGTPGQYVQRQIPFALYDLENDIGETTDCGADHPEIVKRLQSAADAIRAELGEGDKKGPGIRPAANIETMQKN
jgi:hypothetical protein